MPDLDRDAMRARAQDTRWDDDVMVPSIELHLRNDDVLALDKALTEAEERHVERMAPLIEVAAEMEARAEAAEKERDEARHDWRMYVHEIEDEKARSDAAEARAEAAEAALAVAERERDEAQARVDKWRDGEEYRRLYARSAALEEALQNAGGFLEFWGNVGAALACIDAALAPAPAEETRVGWCAECGWIDAHDPDCSLAPAEETR